MSTVERERTMFVATVTMFAATVLLIMLFSVETASAQLSVTAATFALPSNGGPNTFIATSDAIGSSLIGAGTPTVVWAVVQSSDVTAICQQIVNQGLTTFTLSVTDSTVPGDTVDVTVQVQGTGGCLAAPDESGTEFVWSDDQGRTAALVCPQNAGSLGCGAYLYDPVLTQAYNEKMSGQGGNNRRLLSGPTRSLLQPCPYGIIFGGVAVGGYVGWQGGAGCAALLPVPALAGICAVVVLYGTIWTTVVAGCSAYGYNCFPGDAMLQLAGGRSKSMAELDLGDKVAVWKPDGSLGYEEIYGFGHRDAMTTSRFYRISMMNSLKGLETSLELSGGHFAPILSPDTGGQTMIYLRAQEVQIGDTMWGYNDKATTLYNITGISVIGKKGLYNPFTMTGTIVVNGVVASVHSDWFLDEMFDMFGVTYLLPTAYQAILAPPRMLYKVLGKDSYIIAYNWLDRHLNLAQHVSDYSGIVAAISLASVVGAPLYMLKRSKVGLALV